MSIIFMDFFEPQSLSLVYDRFWYETVRIFLSVDFSMSKAAQSISSGLATLPTHFWRSVLTIFVEMVISFFCLTPNIISIWLCNILITRTVKKAIQTAFGIKQLEFSSQLTFSYLKQLNQFLLDLQLYQPFSEGVSWLFL